MIKLDLDLIVDKPTRDALTSLLKSLNSMAILKGQWEAIEANVKGNQALYVIPHSLKFTPTDIIITHKKSTGTITVNESTFNSKQITLTVTGAASTETSEFKAYIGKF